MVKIMVLNRSLVSMLIVVFLTGCSSLMTSPGQKSQQVIPAYTDPDENQGEIHADESVEVIQAESLKTNDRRSARSATIPKKAATAEPVQQEQTEAKIPSQKNTAIPYPLIVQSLIARAEKSMKMQEWLRAQHILEQALHIAPNNGKVFLIYGDVYLNLGILAQAEQMYRRSIALAGEDSNVGRLAKNKLQELKTGN
jgi:tetratricopeptide (TPR) repeat protein